MATRKEIAEDIKAAYGPVLSTADACRYLGMCYEKAKKFLSELPTYDTGKEKRYFAIDIARKMDNCRVLESQQKHA